MIASYKYISGWENSYFKLKDNVGTGTNVCKLVMNKFLI